MDNLALRIQKLFPTANLMRDIIVQDDSDGKGAYIAVWNLPQPRPTNADLMAVVLP